MTTQELLALLIPAGAGLAGGVAQGQQNKVGQQQTQQQMMDQKVQQMMAALQNAQQTGQNLQMNRQQMPSTQAQMSPLGQEQTFVQRQRLMAAMLPEMAKFNVGGPTDPGVKAAYTPPTNMLKGLANPALQASYGDQATATSLADRRKMMAQINPEYQFSSLGNFGLDANYDQQVEDVRMTAGANLKAYEAAQASLANQQTTLANQNMSAALTQPPAEKKGGGVKGFLGGVLKVAAPIAALAIPGVGPMAAAAIAGGGVAAGSKLQGDSWGSALGQGALGAAGGAMAKSQMQGNGLNPFNNGAGPAMNNAMTSASLPATFMGNGMPQGPQLNLPSSNVGGFSPFQQGASQSPSGAGMKPSGGGFNPVAALTGRTSGIPNVNAPAYQRPQTQGQPAVNNRPGGLNIGERSLVEDMFTPLTDLPSRAAGSVADMIDRPRLPQTPYPVVNKANAMLNGFVAGATQGAGDILTGYTSPFSLATLGLGGASKGISAANTMARTSGKAAAANQASNALNTASQAGVANRANQFNQMYQAGVKAPNMNTGLNAKSIMDVLSGNSMSMEQKQQFLMRPEVQKIFQGLAGK